MGRSGGSGGHRSGGGSFSNSGSRAGKSGFSTNRTPSSSSSSPPRRTYQMSNRGMRNMYHNNTPPPPPPPRHHGYSRGMVGAPIRHSMPPPTPPTPRRRIGILGSLVSIISCVIALLMICGAVSCASKMLSNRSSQTQQPYPQNQNVVTDYNNGATTAYKTQTGTYYEDNLDMYLDNSTFTINMEKFEKQTGIKPFVYTCESYNGRTDFSDSDLDDIYRKLKLSNSVLLVYQESGNRYGVWIYIDDSISEDKFPTSAINIMEEYIVSNYEGNMSNAQLLSGAFLATLN